MTHPTPPPAPSASEWPLAPRGTSTASGDPLVGLIMGSASDWPTLKKAAAVLKQFGVPFEAKVVSAHRTPHALVEYATQAEARGLRALIAGAGGAAHLPGMVAAFTVLPVIGVPVPVGALQGQDALLSIVQMPQGVPVACMAIGGAHNAGVFAVQLLAAGGAQVNHALLEKLHDYKRSLVHQVQAMTLEENSSP